jgi:hypothetical protein
MPNSVMDRVHFFGRDQPLQATFTDRSGDANGDDDAIYDNAPDNDNTADSQGELIPEVAPDATNITGVDKENTTPMASHTDPNDSTGVATPTQNVYINDIDASPPPEPDFILPPSSSEQPRQSGLEHKTTERYIPSLSSKSYNYTQLGLSFLQDTKYKYSNEVVRVVLTQLSFKAALKQWGNDARIAMEAEAK